MDENNQINSPNGWTDGELNGRFENNLPNAWTGGELKRFPYLVFDEKHILRLCPLSSSQYVGTIPEKCMLPTF